MAVCPLPSRHFIRFILARKKLVFSIPYPNGKTGFFLINYSKLPKHEAFDFS